MLEGLRDRLGDVNVTATITTSVAGSVSSAREYVGGEYTSDYLPQTVRNELEDIYKFVLVGALAAVLETSILWSFVEIAGLNYLVVAVLAIEFAIVFQYFINNRWTFGYKNHETRRDMFGGLVRTNLVRGTSIPLQVGILYAFVNFGGVYFVTANVGAMVISGVYRYILDSRWTWSNRRENQR